MSDLWTSNSGNADRRSKPHPHPPHHGRRVTWYTHLVCLACRFTSVMGDSANTDATEFQIELKAKGIVFTSFSVVGLDDSELTAMVEPILGAGAWREYQAGVHQAVLAQTQREKRSAAWFYGVGGLSILALASSFAVKSRLRFGLIFCSVLIAGVMVLTQLLLNIMNNRSLEATFTRLNASITGPRITAVLRFKTVTITVLPDPAESDTEDDVPSTRRRQRRRIHRTRSGTHRTSSRSRSRPSSPPSVPHSSYSSYSYTDATSRASSRGPSRASTPPPAYTSIV